MNNPIQTTSGAFKYRDELSLWSNLNDQSASYMIINGDWKTTLGPAEFMAAASLASHSLAMAGVKMPIELPRVAYPSAEEFITGIHRFLSGFKNGFKVLEAAAPTDFATLMKKLRNKVQDLGFSPLLFSTGPKRRGYRLETAPENVSLHMVHPDTGVVWDLSFRGPSAT